MYANTPLRQNQENCRKGVCCLFLSSLSKLFVTIISPRYYWDRSQPEGIRNYHIHIRGYFSQLFFDSFSSAALMDKPSGGIDLYDYPTLIIGISQIPTEILDFRCNESRLLTNSDRRFPFGKLKVAILNT